MTTHYKPEPMKAMSEERWQTIYAMALDARYDIIPTVRTALIDLVAEVRRLREADNKNAARDGAGPLVYRPCRDESLWRGNIYLGCLERWWGRDPHQRGRGALYVRAVILWVI